MSPFPELSRNLGTLSMINGSSVKYPRLTGIGAQRLADGPWRVIVIGAGGWLGLATVELLKLALGDCFERRVACFGSNARRLHLRGGLTVPQRSLLEVGTLKNTPSIVLHLAYLTQDKAKGMGADVYVAANREISCSVLSSLDALGAEGVFVASSGAVTLIEDPQADASKRLYGQLKAEDEDRFADWARRGSHKAAIARIYALSGPYINKPGAYALASFIDDVLDGRPPVVRASRRVYRSWVAISELMSVVFGLLTEPGEAVSRFDTAGPAELEMAEAAKAASIALGADGKVDRAPINASPDERYCGDRAVFAGLLRRFDVQSVHFDDQVRDTAGYMAESRSGGPFCREKTR